jgi:hypothetical protein
LDLPKRRRLKLGKGVQRDAQRLRDPGGARPEARGGVAAFQLLVGPGFRGSRAHILVRRQEEAAHHSLIRNYDLRISVVQPDVMPDMSYQVPFAAHGVELE